MPPKITIVTPSFNQGQFIEETICSVLDQNYPNLEYIVVDGGSTEQTVEVIRKYEPQLSSWVSEKDRGQVHAINKGLARAKGEIFGFFNSPMAENRPGHRAELIQGIFANAFQKFFARDMARFGKF